MHTSFNFLLKSRNLKIEEISRLFYVGITRAEKHTWVLYDESNPSVFIQEFVDMPERNKIERKEDIPEECSG